MSNDSSQEPVLPLLREQVKSRMDSHGNGHGWDHVRRVVRNALFIAKETGGDLRLIEIAALLHDIGDAKLNQGVEMGGTLSRSILESFDCEEDLITKVVHIVENISFRKRASAEPLSLEGQIVQDADRLDAMGAIGIVRAIEFGSSLGRPFFSENSSERHTVEHFHTKLLTLSSLMNTKMAKQMAASREEFMRKFLAQYHSEFFENGDAE